MSGVSPPRGHPTDEKVREVLGALIEEHHRLKHAGESGAVLEANLIAIEYWQDELSRLARERLQALEPPRR
ncbi:MAG TPA: hypothetical protein VLN26_19495 [Gaiellaceae bacterium]|nr:hypothetical protein [Gaiellaceae bacterium]